MAELDAEAHTTPPVGRGQQIIPRPPIWSLGPAAPWRAGTAPTLAQVLRVVPDASRPLLPAYGDSRHSAVLVLFAPGVTDPDVAVEAMLDPHRVLVDGADRLENLPQIRALRDAGYAGPYSFEPFAPEVHDHPDPQAALADSIGHIRATL